MMNWTVHYDDYVIGYDDDDNPIYDTKMSHTELVRRARKETGLRHVISIDWYDTWVDDTNPNKPVERIRAKVIMG